MQIYSGNGSAYLLSSAVFTGENTINLIQLVALCSNGKGIILLILAKGFENNFYYSIFLPL